jgi:hypothetical protein
MAVTRSNTDSFVTQTVYHVLGGFSVSHYSSLSTTYGSNPGPAAALSVSINFSVAVANSLVVVMGEGSSQQCYALAGISGLQTDATGGTIEAYEIAHAYLAAGLYTVTWNSNACFPGQDPNNEADLLGVFVFAP